MCLQGCEIGSASREARGLRDNQPVDILLGTGALLFGAPSLTLPHSHGMGKGWVGSRTVMNNAG